jgi:hypothetical protein
MLRRMEINGMTTIGLWYVELFFRFMGSDMFCEDDDDWFGYGIGWAKRDEQIFQVVNLGFEWWGFGSANVTLTVSQFWVNGIVLYLEWLWNLWTRQFGKSNEDIIFQGHCENCIIENKNLKIFQPQPIISHSSKWRANKTASKLRWEDVDVEFSLNNLRSKVLTKRKK